jgi:hypothetical protein
MVLFGPTNFHTPCTLPLSFRTYTRYFLVPHIASCLIAEDKDTDIGEGWEIMARTAEVGETLQSLTIQDDLVEKIITENAKRYKKRNILNDVGQGESESSSADVTGTAHPANINITVRPLFFHNTIVLTFLTRMSRHHRLSLDVWLVNLPHQMVQ